MIKIFNKKTKEEISIDESIDWVQFTPKHYEENPHAIIELRGFDFLNHARNCHDCSRFVAVFGKETFDWYIEFHGKIFILNFKEIGLKGYGENEMMLANREYFYGTRITLRFLDLPIDHCELKILLEQVLELEDYERACILRDLINREY